MSMRQRTTHNLPMAVALRRIVLEFSPRPLDEHHTFVIPHRDGTATIQSLPASPGPYVPPIGPFVNNTHRVRAV